MELQLEQILSLAPDEKSLIAAQQSSAPRLWSELGLSPDAAWGYCRGATQYEVAVDLRNFRSRCNCPSRKRPCRHALGLLLLLSEHGTIFSPGEPPEAVRNWIAQPVSRGRRAPTAAASATSAASSEEERQQRAKIREARIAQGIDQLQVWLEDLIRQGLSTVELRPEFWDQQARRLVDAQAPGLANRVRQLGELPLASPHWPARLLEALGELQLLLEAYRQLSQLPEALRSDLRQLIGWTISQDELNTQGERVVDAWLVLGQRDEELERLRVRRTWLQGIDSSRPALILQFAPGQQPFSQTLITGKIYATTLQFYPGAVALRARMLDEADPAALNGDLSGDEELEAILQRYGEMLARQPWLPQAAFLLHQATLSLHGNVWYLRDKTGLGVPLSGSQPSRLLAETGGRPADLVFEWNGHHALPLAVSTGGPLLPI